MVDMAKVAPLESFVPEFEEDRGLFDADVREAREFLSAKSWCKRIKTLHLGITVPGVILVLLAEIEPSSNADSWIWVIVGDVPPAYLVTTAAQTPAAALAAYTDEMSRWVEAVHAGADVSDLIPVNGVASQANADALRTRLNLLQTEVLSAYADDLND